MSAGARASESNAPYFPDDYVPRDMLLLTQRHFDYTSSLCIYTFLHVRACLRVTAHILPTPLGGTQRDPRLFIIDCVFTALTQDECHR